MRACIAVLTALAVMGLAYWAYMENFRTQTALREMSKISRDIAIHNEALTMLRAEWAFLNRPDRLRELAELNFGTLGLEPLDASSFGVIEQVAYPPLTLPGLTGVEPEGTLTSRVPGREVAQ